MPKTKSKNEKGKSGRRDRAAVDDIVKAVEKRSGRSKAAAGIEGRLLGYKAGWDSERGLYVKKANAFVARSRAARPARSRGMLHPDAIERGTNPFVSAWGGAAANGFGQFNPKKDTVEPFDEVVATITGDNNYSLVEYAVNPANADTFPQLSQIAKLYESYNFADLEFYLTPLVTVSSAAGRIVLSADAEGIEEADPSTVVIQENNTIHSDGMPYETFGIQIAGVIRHQERWFCRPNKGYPGGADPRLYDAATLYVGSFANATTANIMQLRVRGKVCLYDKLTEPTGLPKTTSLSTGAINALLNWPAATGVGDSPAYDPAAVQNVGTFATVTDSGWILSAPANQEFICPRTSWYMISGSFLFDNSTTAYEVTLSLVVGSITVRNWVYDSTAANADATCNFLAPVHVAQDETVRTVISIVYGGGAMNLVHGHMAFVTL
jgi:hypothetical protein